LWLRCSSFLGHRLLDKPTIIGYEGLGFIDKIGDGELGERVVIEPNILCRKCRYCLSGHGNICVNKSVIGLSKAGFFAEYDTIPSDFAWKVPNKITDEEDVCIELNSYKCRA
jgi:L-iditol 2-dehydrogenase